MPPIRGMVGHRESQDLITHVEGVFFPENGHDVVFLGRAEPGHPALSPEDLMDALVVASRGLMIGEAPGVSIDPTPEQLARGLHENDPMTVRYMGSDRDTRVGIACFEADRKMKSLSLGIDNITKEPTACAVPGYRNELDLISDTPESGRSHSWHRFWIEQMTDSIRWSSDGRTMLVDAILRIKTEYMVVRGGELQSAGEDPDEAARMFSDHMTDNYDAYAAEFPVYHRLEAYAQMTAVADALLSMRDDEDSRTEPPLDPGELVHQHPPAEVDSPRRTPATVVTREDTTRTEGLIRVEGTQLSGGVDLRPKNQIDTRDRQADALGAIVREAMQRDPDLPYWTVGFEGRTLHAIPEPKVSSSEVRTWQVDLSVGDLQLMREYPAVAGQPAVGGWSVSVSTLDVSEHTAEFENLGRAPVEIVVREEPGVRVSLHEVGTVTLPGNAPTLAYMNRRKKKTLARFSNKWLYMDDGIAYVTVDGASYQMALEPGQRVLDFSPEIPHQLLSEETAGGTVFYDYEGGRLRKLTNDRGEWIELEYGRFGRITTVSGSDGQIRYYSYSPDGRLVAVFDEEESAEITYDYSGLTGELVGIRTPLADPHARPSPSARLALELDTDWARAPEEPALEPLPGVSVVRLHHVREPGKRETGEWAHRIEINDRAVRVPEEIYAHVEAVITGEDPQGSSRSILRETFLRDATREGQSKILIVGGQKLREELATALRFADPTLTIVTSPSEARGLQNLGQLSKEDLLARVIVPKSRLGGEIVKDLEEARGGAEDAPVLLYVGHNDPAFVAAIRRAGNEGTLRGRSVILVACGNAETPGLREEILDEFGAVSVTCFSQPLDQRVLPGLVDGIKEELQLRGEGGSAGGTRLLFDIVMDAIKKLLEDAKKGKFPKRIRNLDDIENLQRSLQHGVDLAPLSPPRVPPLREQVGHLG